MPLTLDQIRTALPHIPTREEGGELIISPGTTEEVAAILAYATAYSVPTEIAGAGTKRHWGGQAAAHLILETARISGVREHPWQDLTATVGAGTPWAEMQRTLAAHNQFVALDPLWPDRATVGGVLSTNDSGALRLRYGSARDLVIGMTLVLADGTIAKTGGKVVKNVAGYDLHKLMIGAFGTLAVITEVTFRLHPLPAHRAVWSVSVPEVETLGKLSAAITASHLNPEALQIRTTQPGFALDVLLAAAPAVLRDKSEELRAMAAVNAPSASVVQSDLDVFRAREQFFDRRSAAMVKATAIQTAMPRLLAAIAQAGAPAMAYPLGILYAGFDSALQIPPSLHSSVQHSGGSLTILGDPAEPSTLMRQVKQQFDPGRILNHGLMGGL